eukprot:TRINITY_DN102241_c0_g1_i1.p1 TRINITY_DN102241_c0_g1~~TRINITY_DN102241_c0_g1_i1.p1  ORF type:complete len:596 (+),score=129.32 TRINITY_DN102241_c0_g1_i1:121-1908(+)
MARYDILDLRYEDGTPALLRQSDGSGFAFYPSGRKAICVSAHGTDGEGKTRRLSAIVHSDDPSGLVVASFDEWGRGCADGQKTSGDAQAPTLLIGEKELTIIDGSGKVTTVPREDDARQGGNLPPAEVALRLTDGVSLVHRSGRSMLDFNAAGIAQTFIVGELQGEEVAGMTRSEALAPPEETASMRELDEMTSQLAGMCEKVSALRVDPTQKDARPPRGGYAPLPPATASIADVIENISALQSSLAHPSLAPSNMVWKTEGKLKKMLAGHHPVCPPQGGAKRWTISRFSGRCTAQRLEEAKPTVVKPKSVTGISQLQLPEMLEDCFSTGTLLVVICLASFAQEASAYARLLAEKTNAELHQRYSLQAKAMEGRSSPSPVRLVAVELAESSGFAKQYSIKEVPYCLMFQGGSCVHSKKLSSARMALRDSVTARPRILLVETNPGTQFKVERTLRRSGYESDLALDGAHALRLASQQQSYAVLLISGRFRGDELRSISAAVRQLEPRALVIAFDTVENVEGDDVDVRQQFFVNCAHTFPYLPSYTGLAAILSRHDVAQPHYQHVGQGKEDFLEEILGVMSSSAAYAPVPLSAIQGA